MIPGNPFFLLANHDSCSEGVRRLSSRRSTIHRPLLFCFSLLLAAVDSAHGTGFTTNMDASTVVGQLNFTDQDATASQIVTVAPAACAVSATGKFALAEESTGRVLIWNSVPTTSGKPADLVIGKPDFTTTAAGMTDCLMKSCRGVAFSPDGQKLIVSDSGNSRVLIWNNVATLTNGAKADVVIGQTGFFAPATSGTTADKFRTPMGIAVAPGGQLLVADIYNNRVLIWNSIPTYNGKAADFVLGQMDKLQEVIGSNADQMFYPTGVAVSNDGRILVSDTENYRVLVFNSFPTSDGQPADFVIGLQGFGGMAGASTSQYSFNYPVGVSISNSGQVAISDFGNSRVLIYNSIPTSNFTPAATVLGQPDFISALPMNGGVSAHSIHHPLALVFTDDGRLIVPVREMHRAMIFTPIPDYSVTTSNGIMTVTDLSGNSDTLILSEPSSGSIKFAASGRTFSLNGAAITIGDSGNIPLTGITSVIVNAAAGNNTINTGAFSGSMPSLTINGGAGDDTVNMSGAIDFAANASLDLDLQNDTATPGTDSINVSADVRTAGTGTAVMRVSRTVSVGAAGGLSTQNGGITIEANQQATPTVGQFSGIGTDGAIRTVGTGNVILRGRHGVNATSSSGVAVLGSGSVRSDSALAGAGSIDVTAQGSLGSVASSTGMSVNGGLISTAQGNISIHASSSDASGPATGSNSIGLFILAGGRITAGGVGALGIAATSGTAITGSSRGFVIGDSTSVVSSVDGNITISGISSNAPAAPTSGTGCTGFMSYGGCSLRATGTGSISISGTAGTTSSYTQGLYVASASSITTTTGGITLTGTGGDGAGGFNSGAAIVGAITSTSGGVVSITGTAGTGSGSQGVQVSNGSVSSPTGTISITGTGANSQGNEGIAIGPYAAGTVTAGGDVTLIADSIAIHPTNASLTAGNTVFLRQKTNGHPINLGAADSPSVLGLIDLDELDRITAPTVAIGSATSGPITVSQVVSPAFYQKLYFLNNVNFAAAGGFVSQISSLSNFNRMKVDGTATISPSATLTLNSPSYAWAPTDQFLLLENDAVDAILGTFILSSTHPAWANYTADTGNDLVILQQYNTAPGFVLPCSVCQPWSQRTSGIGFLSSIASSADGSKLAATAEGGPIYTSTDFGVTWPSPPPATPIQDWSGITSSSDGSKLAATVYGGVIFTYPNSSGPPWQSIAGCPSLDWTSITSSADGLKLAATVDGGLIYTFTKSGTTWNWAQHESTRAWTDIASSADGSNLAATAQGGQIYVSTDSGGSWNPQESARNWKAIASSADGSRLAAVAGGGKIYIGVESGSIWTWTPRESDRAWTDITSSADGRRLAATVDNGKIYLSIDFGVTWVECESDRNWLAITSSADGSKLAAVVDNTGTIYTSTSQGCISVTTCSGPASIPTFASSISAGLPIESTQSVSFTVTNDHNSLFTVQPAITPDGTLTFTPCCTAGTAIVTVIAVDNGGTANGGIDTSAPQTFTITVTDPLADWRMLHFGSSANSGNGASAADPDQDGLANLIEYAFGLNPNSGSSLQTPPALLIGGNLVSTFTEPSGMGCITYEAEWSTDLIQWFPIPDSGTGNTHIFSVPVGNHPKMFLRHRITEH